MRKILSVVFITFNMCIYFSCSKVATQEDIERFETVKKINEIRDKYNYSNSTVFKEQKGIFSYKYVEEHEDEIFSIDYKTNNVYTNYDNILSEESEIYKKLKEIKSEHNENHKDIIPGTKEWDYWMIPKDFTERYGLWAYIINEKGKYNEKNKLDIKTGKQVCPFCIYKDSIYKETGEIKEAEKWKDLNLFDSFSGTKKDVLNKIKDDPSYINLQRNYLLDKYFVNFYGKKLDDFINQQWWERKKKSKVPDENRFEKDWNTITVKYSGIIQNMERWNDSKNIDWWVITISGKKCYFLQNNSGIKSIRSHDSDPNTDENIYSIDKSNNFFNYKVNHSVGYLSYYPEGIYSKELLNSPIKDVIKDKLCYRKDYIEDEINKLNIGDRITIIGDIDLSHDYDWDPFLGESSSWISYLKYCQFISVNGKPYVK